MSVPPDPTNDNFDDASSQLTDGLKSCRAVVSNYRALLANDGCEPGTATLEADEAVGN